MAKIERNRAVAAAKEYAKADRSDPFAFARAMTHINNGIVGPTLDGGDAMYSAEEYTETRKLPEGITLSNGDKSYSVAAYKNVRRP